MLPMVRDREQAARFVDAVNGRARTSLLIETGGALNDGEELLGLGGIDEVHIGLESSGHRSWSRVHFRCPGRSLARSHRRAPRRGVTFVLALARLPGTPWAGHLPIDPEIIIGEQTRLGASVVWLGRSYSRASEKLSALELKTEIRWIRNGIRAAARYRS